MRKKIRLLLDLKPHIGGQVKIEEPEKATISFLLNCHLYFFDCVFILKDGAFFRLVVNHRGQVLTLKTYQTLAGAKAAFKRIYRHEAFQPGVETHWSHFYPPDKRWLKRKMTGHA